MQNSENQNFEWPKNGDYIQIYVPKLESMSAFSKTSDPGSGIVGFATENGFLIYFEGNRFDAENLHSWDSKVRQAYGRLVQKYPTVAKSFVNQSDLVSVGQTNGNYVEIFNRELVFAYLESAGKINTIPDSDISTLPERVHFRKR